MHGGNGRVNSGLRALESRRLVRRELLVGAGFCLLGLGALVTAEEGAAASRGGGPTTTPSARRAADRRAVSRVVTVEPVLALTFDDGPDPEYTPAVLDVLARFGVRATFFVVGRNALAHPELVTRAVREGHVVANHTRDHLWLDRLAREEVGSQIRQGRSDLARLGVYPNGLFRPPRGWTSPTVAEVTHRMGLRSVFWNDCLEAHHSVRIDDASAAVIGRAHPGSIILAHDGGRIAGPNPERIDRSRTVEMLPRVLAGIERRGLRAVTLHRLLSSGQPV
jgi:peptidoglycan-N-acetylglucosamine deacetylase